MSPLDHSALEQSNIAALRRPNRTDPAPGHGQLVQMFFNVNVCKSHRGLKALAAEYDIELDTLVPGQYVGFMNRNRNKLKLFAAGNTYAYTVLVEGHFTEEIIRQIPQAFQSRSIITTPDVIGKVLSAPSRLDEKGHYKPLLPVVKTEVSLEELTK